MTVHENDCWHHLYRSPELVARRKKKHLGKLKKIGVLDLPRHSRIIDLCCGQGEILDLLAERGFTQLLGADHSPESYLITPPEKRLWRYHQISMPQIPFPVESVDFILCTHSLHHLEGQESIRKLIENAYSCLKKGGTLALIDHYDSFQLRLAFGILRSPLAQISHWMRTFREQLIQEHHYLYRYLDAWPQTHQILFSTARFAQTTLRKDPFFFYFTGVK